MPQALTLPRHTTVVPAWVERRRAEGQARCDALPWPTVKDEGWRRTNLRGVAWDTIPQQPPIHRSPVRDIPGEIQQFAEGWQDGGLLIHQDATTGAVQLTDELQHAGVLFTSLAAAASSHAALVDPLLGTDPALYATPLAKLTALNLARWTHGTFVYVPRGVAVRLPLRIAHLSTSAEGLLAPRTLVVLEPGSELTLIEETFAAPDAHAPVIPSVVELIVREGATLRYYHLQNWGRTTRHFFNQHAVVERDGQLLSLLGSVGSALTKAAIDTRLIGPGARSDLYGVTFGDTTQQFEFHTLQDHIAGHTTSDLLYKTALQDQAVSIYTGLIRIAKAAQKSNAYQANRNLLLSQHAKADSIPMLEILADDVRCTHGATVGPVDADQAFYLTSRGIPFPIAERMIVEGFFTQVIEKLPLRGIQERLHAAIDRKLRVPS